MDLRQAFFFLNAAMLWALFWRSPSLRFRRRKLDA
jgi:hypothetical protein